MRQEIRFPGDVAELAAWLYLPEGPGPHPAVVMAHGFSAVKEMGLDAYARVFCEAGLAVIVHDHPNFGASGGEPRLHADPWLQTRGYRHAITYAQTRAEIDPARIGVWGTSFSGGHALVVAAIDRRVKCVVATVPVVSGKAIFDHAVPPSEMAAQLEKFYAERRAIAGGAAPTYVPVAREGTETYDWIIPASEGTTWENRQTVLSQEGLFEYEPRGFIRRISPTPLLMIVGSHDFRAVTTAQLQAYEEALEPKKLLLIESGHYDTYGRRFKEASESSRDWFVEHLMS